MSRDSYEFSRFNFIGIFIKRDEIAKKIHVETTKHNWKKTDEKNYQ
jgi:hypothetical protein